MKLLATYIQVLFWWRICTLIGLSFNLINWSAANWTGTPAHPVKGSVRLTAAVWTPGNDSTPATIYFWTVTTVVLVLGGVVFYRLRPHFADVV